MRKDLRAGVIAVTLAISAGAAAIAAWITHLFWSFGILISDDQSIGQIGLAAVGAFVPEIGAIHGVYLWVT